MDEENGNIKWSKFFDQYTELSCLLCEQEVRLYCLKAPIEAHKNTGTPQRYSIQFHHYKVNIAITWDSGLFCITSSCKNYTMQFIL